MSQTSLPLQRVTWVSLGSNVGLFLLKLVAFVMSGSVALLSDAIHSLLDVASSVAVLISVRVGRTAPDREHPFGHSRAEPIAGFVIAITACVLGIEIIQQAVVNFIEPKHPKINAWVIAILVVAILIQLCISYWQKRVGEREKSGAVIAAAIEARNDAYISVAVLVGIIGTALGFAAADQIAALLVGLLVLWSGVQIIRGNLDQLLGRAPSEFAIERIKHLTMAVPGVEEIRFCRGHYVGNELHFEIIIACRGSLSTQESCDIADMVRLSAESEADVRFAFVHVDTVESPHHYPELLGKLD